MNDTALRRTPLYEAHLALGAKMVPFAGYEMPVQYPLGVLGEHKWTRESAGLFDVSHMGQWQISGADAAEQFEKLVPADVIGLSIGQQRYSQFLNEDGGTLDDLMVTRSAAGLYVVVNAGCKDADLAHVQAHGFQPNVRDDLALIALQGPKAEEALAKLNPAIENLAFMHAATFELAGIQAQVSRSGYTGEDGFEISIKAEDATALWNKLLSDPLVKAIGLGARDSLRLEAGLCLYGHELDETISPIEAGLQWSIAKRRRHEGGFIGSARVQAELQNGVARKRVGIKPEGRAPARDGTEIQDAEGRKIGTITSGGFGPSLNGPIAIGYVETAHATPGTAIQLIVRGQAMPASIVNLPFIPKRFKK